jgi:hypothetical protein
MERLQERAEEFSGTGQTHFYYWELKAWFSASNISKNVRRTIHSHLIDSAPDRVPAFIELSDRYIFVDKNSMKNLDDHI